MEWSASACFVVVNVKIWKTVFLLTYYTSTYTFFLIFFRLVLIKLKVYCIKHNPNWHWISLRDNSWKERRKRWEGWGRWSDARENKILILLNSMWKWKLDKGRKGIQISDSLMYSERVLMIKEMWLFSVSIHLHLVFSLWLTLSCIFKENLGLATLPFTLLCVISTFRGSVCCHWQTYHCLSYQILLVTF